MQGMQNRTPYTTVQFDFTESTQVHTVPQIKSLRGVP